MLLIAAAFGIYWIYAPAQARTVVDRGADALYRFWYDKELLIAGDSNLADKSIRDLLPTELSTLWWLMNTDIVEGDLRKSPWIRKADVHPCASKFLSLWGCFVVTIEERKPSFLVTEGDVTWLVGEDGGFISPLTPRVKDLFRGRTLRNLKGFYDDNPSADLFQARFHYASEAVGIIEKRMHRKVASVQLLPGGEIEVEFEDNPFRVVFSGGVDSAEPLHFELDRLDVLLSQIEGKEGTVEKIDLAFNKLAVVKFREGTGAPPSSTPTSLQLRPPAQ